MVVTGTTTGTVTDDVGEFTLSSKDGVRSLTLSSVGYGGDNLTNSTYYSFLFVGPNIAGLATSAAGGTGDGYIIPAPYKASYYGSVQLAFRP